MDLELTLTLMAAAALTGGVGLWGARRKRPIGEVSFVPWHGLLFVGILGFCALAAHLVTLTTGVPLKGMGR
jgi:hypothetical protein